jgi:hypothetical protein
MSVDRGHRNRLGTAPASRPGPHLHRLSQRGRKEAARPDGIEAIATPPRLHFPIAKIFLETRIDVFCERPMTLDLAEARALVDPVHGSDRLFCLTHCYTGYPMVHEARVEGRRNRQDPLDRWRVQSKAST